MRGTGAHVSPAGQQPPALDAALEGRHRPSEYPEQKGQASGHLVTRAVTETGHGMAVVRPFECDPRGKSLGRGAQGTGRQISAHVESKMPSNEMACSCSSELAVTESMQGAAK